MTLDAVSGTGDFIKSIVTSDVDHLAAIQKGKNRRYTQIKPGKFQGRYSECNLSDVQLFRERLNIGMRIEAAPKAQYMPFAAVYSDTHDLNFCGSVANSKTLLQASGGEWDACSSGVLNYVGAAFNRDRLNTAYNLLYQREFPKQWSCSKAALTCPRALRQYLYILQRTLILMETFPLLGGYEQVCQSLNEMILHAILDALTPTLSYQEKTSSFSARRKGVRKAIDYLHVHINLMPTVTELCQVSGLSERSLQYGFKEYIGISPVRYLRVVRLNEARRELMTSRKKRVKVMDVALNWGFVEMGRFSGEYRQLFQELPSETLKASRNQ